MVPSSLGYPAACEDRCLLSHPVEDETRGELGARCECDDVGDKALAPESLESLTERMLACMAAGGDAVVAALEKSAS